jgi:hypothetical protein
VRRPGFVLAPIAFVVLLVGASAARSTSDAAQVRTLRTVRSAEALAADGSRAAVAIVCERRYSFYELYAWNPVRRLVVSLARRRDRHCYESSTGEGISEIGIAGRTVAWVHYDGGNYRRQYLATASLRSPRSTTKLTEDRWQIPGGAGDWVGNVHGDRSLLVFNTWSVCVSDGGSHPCPEGMPPGFNVYNETLWRIVGRGKRLILARPDELTVLAVAAGRILVRRADGSLELRRADGGLLRSFPFAREEVKGAVLDSSELVVLHRVSRRLTWSVFDPRSGEERRLAAQTGAIPADVEHGFLVYIVGRVVHVLRLADGRQKGFTTVPGSHAVAQLEPSGLFYSGLVYSYSGRHEGRVRFVPFNQIRFR